MTDAPYNAADEKAVKRRKADKGFLEKQRLMDWQWLLMDVRGRRIVHALLTQSGLETPSYRPGQPDQTSFNEGRRSLGFELQQSVLHISRDAYVAMIAENTKGT